MSRAAEQRVIKIARRYAKLFRGLNFPSKRGLIYQMIKAVEALDRRRK